MELEGKITEILPEVKGQGKNGEWRRQDFILEVPGDFPKKVCMTVWGDRINLNDFKVNDSVTASFDLESREFNGKWFTTVKAWKITKSVKTEGDHHASGANENSDSVINLNLNDEAVGDLPF